MKNITKVSVTSRRSVKIGDQFLTFEMLLEADTTKMKEDERDKQIEEMWQRAGEEVDNQISEAANSI